MSYIRKDQVNSIRSILHSHGHPGSIMGQVLAQPGRMKPKVRLAMYDHNRPVQTHEFEFVKLEKAPTYQEMMTAFQRNNVQKSVFDGVRQRKVKVLRSIFRRLQPHNLVINLGHEKATDEHMCLVLAYDSPLAINPSPRSARFQFKKLSEVPTPQEIWQAFREYRDGIID